jgi:hypothetical protein
MKEKLEKNASNNIKLQVQNIIQLLIIRHTVLLEKKVASVNKNTTQNNLAKGGEGI